MKSPANQPTTPTVSHPLRNGLLCCFIFLACYGAAWPVTRMGFIDDWSFFATAQTFARTGHIVYNGWADPMVGWLIPWGAFFIKLFGSSYMAVRLSILPIDLLTILLFHSILIRFGITPRNAILGTLTLALCPLFLPFASVYMTDVPCLLAIVFCLYCCLRAVSAQGSPAAIAWLALAAVSNTIGGTARQAAWLGILVMVPCTGWLLRKHRAVLISSIALWLAGVGAVACCMHWFAQQPYVPHISILPKPPGSLLIGLYEAIMTVDFMGALLLCLLLMIFPVLVAWLPRFGRKFDHYIVLFCMGLLPILAVKYLTGDLGIVWPGSTLNWELSMQRHAIFGTPPWMQHSLLPTPARIFVSVILIAALLGCIFALQNKGWKTIRSAEPDQAREFLWLVVPFSLGYFALLLLAAWHGLVLGKYVLDWMPFAILASIWLYQRCVRTRLPAASVVLLIFYAAFTVATTHTLFAWHRARFAAIHELRAAGIPRTEIQAGFEYDGETQIKTAGYINNKAIQHPPRAYQPPRKHYNPNNLCDYNFIPFAPVLHPKYAIGFGPQSCYLPSSFPSVRYTAWLPPFHRSIRILKIPSPPRTVLLNHP